MKLIDMTAVSLSAAIKKREVSVEEAVKASLAVIAEKEERLNCYVTVDEKGALAEAQRVQKAIESVSEGRTSIFIAHRLSTIRNSDVIFYLENGKIAESGTHDELLKLGGKYAALVASK